MVNTAELRQIFPLRGNTLRHVVEGDGRYPRAMTPSVYGAAIAFMDNFLHDTFARLYPQGSRKYISPMYITDCFLMIW